MKLDHDDRLAPRPSSARRPCQRPVTTTSAREDRARARAAAAALEVGERVAVDPHAADLCAFRHAVLEHANRGRRVRSSALVADVVDGRSSAPALVRPALELDRDTERTFAALAWDGRRCADTAAPPRRSTRARSVSIARERRRLASRSSRGQRATSPITVKRRGAGRTRGAARTTNERGTISEPVSRAGRSTPLATTNDPAASSTIVPPGGRSA